MRNANGTGNIIKLKGNRRKPFALRISVWDKDYTIRKRKIIATFKTYKEADQFRLKLLDTEAFQQKKDIYITFKECALESLKRAEDVLSDNTIKSYRGCLEVLKPLWNVRMKDFTAEQYQFFVDQLIEEGIKAKRLSNINSLTRRAVKVAIRKGLLSSDPTIATDIGGSSKKADRLRVPFSHQEIANLWKHSNESMAREILMMIYLGLRVDEYLSLDRDYIDLDNRCISVKHSKTKAGIRIVPIADCIFPFVEAHTERFGKLSEHNTYSPFTKWFKRYMSKLGYNHIPHETRYTFATLLDEARLPDGHRIDITVEKVLIGHRVSDITKGTYTHENFDRLREAVNSLPLCL